MTSVFKIQHSTLLSSFLVWDKIYCPEGIKNKSTNTISARTQTNRDLCQKADKDIFRKDVETNEQ